MNTSMHGKIIDYIDLNPAWTQGGNPERISSGRDHTLQLSVTYHGDRDEVWIVLGNSDGEVARYNPRGVQHIRWASLGKSEVHK